MAHELILPDRPGKTLRLYHLALQLPNNTALTRTSKGCKKIIAKTLQSRPPKKANRDRLFDDFNRTIRRHAIEEIDDIRIAHANATMGSRNPHHHRIRTAVNIDIAAHGIDTAKTIAPWLNSRQPKYARENPITPRKQRRQLRAIQLTTWPTTDKNCIFRNASPNLGTNDMPTTRRAITAAHLPNPFACRGNWITGNPPPVRVIKC